jgi:hypothetical protein
VILESVECFAMSGIARDVVEWKARALLRFSTVRPPL